MTSNKLLSFFFLRKKNIYCFNDNGMPIRIFTHTDMSPSLSHMSDVIRQFAFHHSVIYLLPCRGFIVDWYLVLKPI